MATDNRDEIIRTQLDVISTLIDHNIRRLSDDIWGTPSTVTPPKAPSKDEQSDKGAAHSPAPKAAAEAPTQEEPPVDIETLKKELNELIGLEGIKREVNSFLSVSMSTGGIE
ncbi:MAG: hypothetical protein E7317_11805, partial [Clostridiales bacterium]|nr:hypothetical protein [Clostridiales bacterium]